MSGWDAGGCGEWEVVCVEGYEILVICIVLICCGALFLKLEGSWISCVRQYDIVNVNIVSNCCSYVTYLCSYVTYLWYIANLICNLISGT